MKLAPLDDRIVVQRLEAEETTEGGIVLPDTAKEKPQQAKVVAVGPGRMLDDGSRAGLDVKVGDTVLIGKYQGTEIIIDGEDYVFLKAEDLLAVLS